MVLVPDEVQQSCRVLVDRLRAVAGASFTALYVHGSAVLGDFHPGASDLDLLVVVREGVARDQVERMARVLADENGGQRTGLEASVVELPGVQCPAAPWPYRVHVTTAPSDRKVVWCEPQDGDADLILHYSVARQAGWAAHGPAPQGIIGEVSRPVVARQLVAELRWATEHADESYAVLNACRALRFKAEAVFCSKAEGGTWAVEQGVDVELVRGALQARSERRREPCSQQAIAFALDVAASMERDPRLNRAPPGEDPGSVTDRAGGLTVSTSTPSPTRRTTRPPGSRRVTTAGPSSDHALPTNASRPR